MKYKNKILLLLLFVLIPVFSVQAFLPKKDSFVELFSQVLDEKVEEFPFETSLWIEDLRNKNSDFIVSINGTKSVVAASVIKLPILAVCFQLAKEGKLDLQGWYAMNDKDRTEGSGVIKGIKTGKKFRHVRLMELMTTKSDNTAANALIRIIGIKTMNKYFKKIGLKDTVLNRYILHSSRKEGVENYTSARDCAYLLKKIYNRQCVSEEYSNEMLAFMEKQKVRNRIPRLLPKKAKVANKTGTLFGAFHDVGLVYADKGDMIVCVFVEGDFQKYTKAKDFISDIARVSYDYYLGYLIKQDKAALN